MLVHAFPRVLLFSPMPGQDFPEDHTATKHIHFMIVFRMRVPELRGLPVDSPDQAADHRVGRLLDLRKTKVGYFCRPFGCDEDIGRLAVTVNDGGFVDVEVHQAGRDIVHGLQDFGVQRCRDIANIVEEVTV